MSDSTIARSHDEIVHVMDGYRELKGKVRAHYPQSLSQKEHEEIETVTCLLLMQRSGGENGDVQNEVNKSLELLRRNTTMAKRVRHLMVITSLLLAVVMGVMLVTYIFPPSDKAAGMNGELISQILDTQKKDDQEILTQLEGLKTGHIQLTSEMMSTYNASLESYRSLNKTLDDLQNLKR